MSGIISPDDDEPPRRPRTHGVSIGDRPAQGKLYVEPAPWRDRRRALRRFAWNAWDLCWRVVERLQGMGPSAAQPLEPEPPSLDYRLDHSTRYGKLPGQLRPRGDKTDPKP